MGSPATSAQFVKLLVDDLTEVSEFRYKELDEGLVEKFYRQMDSQKAQEEFYGIGDMPDIPEFSGELEYLSRAPGYSTKIEPQEFAGGTMLERKLIDDKRYPVMEAKTMGLMEAAARVKEKKAVHPFAYMFSSAFDFMKSEEGVALCSSSHTTKADGVSTSDGFDNAGTSAMTKGSVAATRILMRQFRSDIGERINVSDNLALVGPDELADTMDEIVGTPKGLYSGEGTKNVAYGRYKPMPILRLSDYDTNDWAMVDLDMMKKCLIWINRIMPPELTNTRDFDTYVLKFALYMRFANGFTDWRWIYGHSVT